MNLNWYYIIARSGELPAALEKKLWNQPIEGLLITSGLTFISQLRISK